MLFFPQALDEEIGFIAEGKKQFSYLFLIVENIGPVYPSQWVKVSSGLQANFTGRITLSPRSTLPALLTCFVMRDILCNVHDFKQNLKFSMENTLKSRKNGYMLSSYTESTLCCSDVYNLAQKLDNSLQIVKIDGHAWRG